MLFSSSIVYSFQCHGVQHARFSRPLPSPKVCSNSCPLSQWFYPTISSSVFLFSCQKSLPASGSFQMSQLCIMWPKYWSFCFSISPPNEYLGLISFRIDWFGLLAVQGTFKSLLQHHISKASILQHSVVFMVQLLHPYMTTGKVWLEGPLLLKSCLCFLISCHGWS